MRKNFPGATTPKPVAKQDDNIAQTASVATETPVTNVPMSNEQLMELVHKQANLIENQSARLAIVESMVSKNATPDENPKERTWSFTYAVVSTEEWDGVVIGTRIKKGKNVMNSDKNTITATLRYLKDGKIVDKEEDFFVNDFSKIITRSGQVTAVGIFNTRIERGVTVKGTPVATQKKVDQVSGTINVHLQPETAELFVDLPVEELGGDICTFPSSSLNI